MDPIVRGTDTDHHGISLPSQSLWAISAYLSYNFKDDQELLEQGMIL